MAALQDKTEKALLRELGRVFHNVGLKRNMHVNHKSQSLG